jgi:hypothetical protein
MKSSGSIALGLLLAACGSSLGQIARVTPIVLKGAAAPGCGTSSTFTNFRNPFINNSGALAFWGSTNDNYTGVWTWTGSTLLAVGTGTISNSDFTVNPAINSSGSVAYRALTSSTTSGVFRWDAGTTTTIASSSQAIPDETGAALSGSPVFDVLEGLSGGDTRAVLLSDQGHVLFQHSVTTSSEYIHGWWWSDGSSLKALAYLRRTDPGQIPISWYPGSPWGSDALWNTGTADVNSGGSGTSCVVTVFNTGTSNDTAIHSGSPGSLTAIAVEGGSSPDGSIWRAFASSTMNNNDRVSSRCQMGSPTPLNSIALIDPDAVVDRAGDPAPDTGDNYYGGGTTVPIWSGSLNDNDRVLFTERLAATPTDGETGLWSGPLSAIRLYARGNQAVPCRYAGTYVDTLPQFADRQGLNNPGQFVFMADMDDGTQKAALFGVDPRFNRAWIIAKVGDTVRYGTGSTNIGTVVALDVAVLGAGQDRNNPASGHAILNDCGVVTFWMLVDDGTTQYEGIYTHRMLPADINDDGAYNVLDNNAFLNAFSAGNLCLADFNGDGNLNVLDFNQFQNAAAVSGSCP